MAQAPPNTAVTAPRVVARAFAVTMERSGTTCGSAAESPDPANREMAITSSASMNNQVPPTPSATPPAQHRMATARRALAMIRTRLRSHRSSSAPVNGAISEYGSSSTAKPPAMVSASAARCGLNSTAPASPAWKTPSPHCAGNRVQSRCRNSTSRKSARGEIRSVAPSATAVSCPEGALVVTMFQPTGIRGGNRPRLIESRGPAHLVASRRRGAVWLLPNGIPQRLFSSGPGGHGVRRPLG